MAFYLYPWLLPTKDHNPSKPVCFVVVIIFMLFFDILRPLPFPSSHASVADDDRNSSTKRKSICRIHVPHLNVVRSSILRPGDAFRGPHVDVGDDASSDVRNDDHRT